MNTAEAPPATLMEASTAEAAAAAQWIENLPRGARVAVCHSGEVDGAAGAALAIRFLQRSGRVVSEAVTPDKGKDIGDMALHARLRRTDPDALLILDQSRPNRPILPDKPTFVIDGDEPADMSMPPLPRVSAILGDANPPAPTSLKVYRILSHFVDLADVAWYASLGVVADRGTDALFPEHVAAKKRWGQKHLVETAALINAAKRASAHDTATALSALLNAEAPSEIADGMIAEYDVLDEYRLELQQERSRCAKVSPQFAGDWAVVRFSSPCQIEGSLSASWVGRLPKNFILAANDGYLPGCVYFSVRTRRSREDLNASLSPFRGFSIHETSGPPGCEWITGIATKADFDRLLSDLGIAVS